MRLRRNDEDLPLGQWVRVGLRVLDEIEAAARREPVAPLEVRQRLGDAVVALHDVRRMVDLPGHELRRQLAQAARMRAEELRVALLEHDGNIDGGA